MNRTRLTMLVAAAGLMLAACGFDARATAIYTWHPVNEETPYVPVSGSCIMLANCGLQLEVTDAAYYAGSMEYSIHWGHFYFDPDSPIIEMHSVTQLLRPRAPPTYFWPFYLSADVRFGRYMTGGIEVNDNENSYRMSSYGQAPLWTIYGFRSDNPDWGCYQVEPYVSCSGASGYWLLTSPPSPIAVPEPDTLAAFGLLALGLLAARTAEHWRHTHHRDGSGRRTTR